MLAPTIHQTMLCSLPAKHLPTTTSKTKSSSVSIQRVACGASRRQKSALSGHIHGNKVPRSHGQSQLVFVWDWDDALHKTSLHQWRPHWRCLEDLRSPLTAYFQNRIRNFFKINFLPCCMLCTIDIYCIIQGLKSRGTMINIVAYDI